MAKDELNQEQLLLAAPCNGKGRQTGDEKEILNQPTDLMHQRRGIMENRREPMGSERNEIKTLIYANHLKLSIIVETYGQAHLNLCAHLSHSRSLRSELGKREFAEDPFPELSPRSQ